MIEMASKYDRAAILLSHFLHTRELFRNRTGYKGTDRRKLHEPRSSAAMANMQNIAVLHNVILAFKA